jgi:hypothetical protein
MNYTDGPIHRRQPSSSRPPPRLWGSLPGRSGVLIVLGSSALGLLVTVLAGREPGLLLGIFVIAGTVIGALSVRREAVRLIIPVPALAYLAAAMIAGLIDDPAASSSRTALALGGLQWIASGFLVMIEATVIAIALALVRRRRKRRDAGAGLNTPGRAW